jgi:hypothetical protein
LTIRGPLEAEEIKPNYICREAKWELFQNYLVNNLNTQYLDGNCSKSEIDVAVNFFSHTLNRAIRYAIMLERKSFKSMQIATSTYILIQKRKNFGRIVRELTILLFTLSLIL